MASESKISLCCTLLSISKVFAFYFPISQKSYASIFKICEISKFQEVVLCRLSQGTPIKSLVEKEK